MDISLTDTEVRVLGCLLEKEMATPDYYPLSLNGLVNACNQKTNRDPVVTFDETTVTHALDLLKEKRLVWQSDASRVPKFAQNLSATLKLVRKETAVICLLLVRGPQTAGELRSRSERLYDFGSLDEIAATLKNMEEMGLVKLLPRLPGHKESRYIHLLAPVPEKVAPAAIRIATAPSHIENERIAALEAEVGRLKMEVEELRREVDEFKALL